MQREGNRPPDAASASATWRGHPQRAVLLGQMLGAAQRDAGRLLEVEANDHSIEGDNPCLGYPSFMALDRITVNPNRMRGLPCIRDTRVTVSAVLGQLAAGASVDDLLADYPYLERDDVLAALEYAATDAQERELQVAAPA